MTGRPAPAIGSLLACPACRARLEWVLETMICSGCAATYPVHDGIPDFCAGIDAAKAGQAQFFDADVDPEYEIERPNGTPPLYGRLYGEKFRRATSGLGSLSGRTVLVICGGSGMEAEHLARAGAQVISLDVSRGAAGRAQERSRRHGVALLPVVGDAERLPFADRSVDVVFVHDGLHHLESPETAVAEMARVARSAVSINEPAAAAVTRLSVRVGVSVDVEPAGNAVNRLTLDGLRALLEPLGFRIVGAERYALYNKHEPGRLLTALSRPGLLQLAMLALRAFNGIAGGIGNKLSVRAVREADRR